MLEVPSFIQNTCISALDRVLKDTEMKSTMSLIKVQFQMGHSVFHLRVNIVKLAVRGCLCSLELLDLKCCLTST
jgi:hypothetical protein